MVENPQIGESSPLVTVDVEIWQLKFFAKAVGETNPVYFDEEHARQVGHRSILAPPTYAVTLSSAVPDPFVRVRQMGMDTSKVLHTNQRFDYFAPIYGRDEITFDAKIVDFYAKLGGKFQFMVEQIEARNQFGELTTRFSQTVVERKG